MASDTSHSELQRPRALGFRWWMLPAFAALLAVPAACWIIPWRLSHSDFSTHYTFGYIGDEYDYARRMAPLIPGTTATNPVNGVCDPDVISPMFLEDTCRAVMDATGDDVCEIWKLQYPQQPSNTENQK
jgi:hypothetical protein